MTRRDVSSCYCDCRVQSGVGVGPEDVMYIWWRAGVEKRGRLSVLSWPIVTSYVVFDYR